MINYILKLLRVKQWYKNILILIPAFFAAVEWNAVLVHNLLLGFVAFSLLASAVYLINDLKDKSSDAEHPTKRFRLIASNKLSKKNAVLSIVLLLLVSLSALFWIDKIVLFYALLYLFLNLSYSFYLKKIPVIDILILLMGYPIRILIGAEITTVPISFWLYMLVLSIALYVLLIKRRSDVLLNDNSAKVMFYTRINLKQVLNVLLAAILITYISYVLIVYINHNSFLLAIATIPFSFIAAFLFHRDMLEHPHQDPLSILSKDFIFVGGCVIWTLLFGFTLYL